MNGGMSCQRTFRTSIKHLNDEELDRLLAVTLAEAKRRDRQTTPTHERSRSQNADAPVSLTRGQLNAVRAAFKAGITPARIARQFGLSQSDVRTALATGASKGGTAD
jgi:predicted DNA binding protein